MPFADTVASSGMASAMLTSRSRLSASCDTVFFRPTNAALLSSFSVKLPLLSPTLFSRFKPAIPLPTPSSAASAIPDGSTGTKLARTLEVGLLLSLADRAFGDRPRVSGELESETLFSKMERRLRTAEEERCSDMAAVSSSVRLA